MRIGICGICGRMGVMIMKEALQRGHSIAAAFDHDGAPLFGRDAGALLNMKDLGVTVAAVNEEDVARCDGIIDFSSPAATMRLLDAAIAQKKPLVIGTTGFSAEETGRIRTASGVVPLLFSPNMSRGVNVLFRLTEFAAGALGPDYDVEIFEAHHRFKKDAPSGTARRLVEAVKSAMKGLGGAKEVAGRSGMTGERTSNEIGVHAMRGGDIVGEHTVFFVTAGERIELTHRATSRESLARGAVAAVEFCSGKSAGLYTMYDVLGFK
ncbi:MAG TPA: 4-hydroxy-tetrahydrodipicolinate reductase [Spirochaetota bacterium]|nr:4-hydroxy-tetrahydrodipicolinate reductase [Spirochaetota bacterium]HPG49449.1 4-hydroxy-tetrahydrodipicolinate reductase [Spirochaetota bacterium]HPN13801.1 4-hydroxy-tetrahydrodipicolinate reductase [Spirochaetota bacterium]